MTTVPIHPDYEKLRIGDAPRIPGLLFFINTIVTLQNLFRKRSSSVDYEKHTIDAENGRSVKIEVVRPAGERPSDCLVYFPGGGFSVKAMPGHYQNVEHYAENAHCAVVMVSYRLAPKYPFPAGLNDCFTVLRWVHAHAQEIGINATNIVIGGDSAGGCMTAAVSQRVLDNLDWQPKAQMMIYPVTDSSCSTYSATEYTHSPVFSAAANKSMWEAYLSGVDMARLPPYASPISRENMAGLPRTYLETAEFDPLHDEGITYAEKLMSAGVDTQLENTKETVHGFDLFCKNEHYTASMAKRVAFLRSAFDC